MKIILSTRWMRVKKDWKSLLCWLLLPIVLTILLMKSVGAWQEEMTVPIALVVEEETELAVQLVSDIAGTELLNIQFMELEDALHKLEQHELDSVFVIREGYEEAILAGRRNQLIEAYSSNRSFAYLAVVETITSFAQQDVARSKAAFVIKQLFKDFQMEDEWNYTEIIEKSRERQQNEALLQSSFSYYDKEGTDDEQSLPLLQVWGVWALFAMITTFFLFDWVAKESRPDMRSRWLFTMISFRMYALGTLLLYTVVLFLVDMFTAILFSALFHETLSIQTVIALFAFRITINLLAFLLASVLRQLLMYYVGGLALSLLLIVVGGAIIPMDGFTRKWPWLEALSPVSSLLTGTIPVIWLLTLAALLGLWIVKGGNSRVESI